MPKQWKRINRADQHRIARWVKEAHERSDAADATLQQTIKHGAVKVNLTGGTELMMITPNTMQAAFGAVIAKMRFQRMDYEMSHYSPVNPDRVKTL